MNKMIQTRGTLLDPSDFGPDPIKYDLYKRKIEDPGYMEFAINKIAVELTHFLSK
jgi:hypothetical protein